MSKPSQKRVELIKQGKTLLRTMKRRAGNRDVYVVASYNGYGWENYHWTNHHKTEKEARLQLQKFVQQNLENILDDCKI